MMSRPVVLVFLLVILIITSQFEWKAQLANEIEASRSISQKQQHISSREEIVKEKLMLLVPAAWPSCHRSCLRALPYISFAPR
uniref:Uncharacterized protein LOC105038287 isoform X2 n=1 Tax=Elaeis guineensis var. tenera TaxID=51953 RepID=A0A8N4EVR5_ELAGV|nr:uncharacterized protein LOC105038287 isoform X2 [Elaeis guineensis]